MLRLGYGIQRALALCSTTTAVSHGRMLSSNSSGVKRTTKSTEESLFAPENLEGVSKIEQARMKVTYGLLKEHVTAVEQGLPPPDPQRNPMIDSRSFDVGYLPQIHADVLKALRRELPAKLADGLRPVPTHSLWESSEDENRSNLAARHSDEWAAVDERTMEHRQFSKMQRQAMHGLGVEVSPAPPASGIRSKRLCVLSDSKGRVDVDFRMVGKVTSFVSEGGKLLSRRRSGLSAKAQRKMSRAVKSARQMALIAPDPRPGPTMDELRQLYQDAQ